MMRSYIVTALFGVTACVVQAAGEDDLCEKLADGLAAQAELLSDVTDAASAAAVLPKLRENIASLSALNGAVPDEVLWRYIENTPDVKLELIECVQKISTQYSRLAAVGFFTCDELKALLIESVIPAGDAQ